MKQLLIGNDILISWAVFMQPVGSEAAEPYDLEGKDIKVLAYNALRKVEMDIAEIKGNVVKLRFYGKDQKFTGAYSLVLIENDGKEGMHTIDKCGAFQLVRQSCDMCSCGDAENIQITTLELESVVDAVIMAGSGVVDAELSLESENAVQNKVITEALNGKQETIADLDAIRQGAEKGATAVQEVEGYGLSQEDFTTALKEKLSGLENYDDAEVQAAIEALGKRLDALVGTSASEAIDTFNEIVAFLNGVEDTATLEGILADIGKQISAVEAKIPNAVTEDVIRGWGFTKNGGTVQSVTINGESKTPDASGVVDLGEIKGGGGGYQPMSNTYYSYTSGVTMQPNTSIWVEIWDSVSVQLVEPADTSVSNEYVIVVKDFGNNSSLIFNKTITWANDNPPILGDNDKLVEISIKYIDFRDSFGRAYLGTWAKFDI